MRIFTIIIIGIILEFLLGIHCESMLGIVVSVQIAQIWAAKRREFSDNARIARRRVSVVQIVVSVQVVQIWDGKRGTFSNVEWCFMF